MFISTIHSQNVAAYAALKARLRVKPHMDVQATISRLARHTLHPSITAAYMAAAFAEDDCYGPRST